jgi:hypothetical protein
MNERNKSREYYEGSGYFEKAFSLFPPLSGLKFIGVG